MKPWAKYSFNGKDWIPDREADIITHLKTYYKSMRQEACMLIHEKLDTLIEETTMENNVVIAPTNVITFGYANWNNDPNPVVLVTSVDANFVCGYNLNYFANEGLAFRKYTRSNMKAIQNLTSEILKPVLKLKDLNVGDRARYTKQAKGLEVVVTSKTPANGTYVVEAIITKADGKIYGTTGITLRYDSEIEVEKIL